MVPASTAFRAAHWPSGLPRTIHVPATSLFYNVEHAARRYPGKTAIQYFGTAMPYTQLLQEIEQLAGYLQQDCGVKPGDRVMLCAQNCPQYIIASYAILRAEAVLVPANPMWLTGEIEHVADDSGARVAIVAEDLYAQVAPLHGRAIERVITFAYADALADDGGLPVPGWVRDRKPLSASRMTGPATTWLAAMAVQRVPLPHRAGPDTLALLAYTSGTTGRPKGCMHTHRSLMCAAAGSQVWRANGPESVFLAVAPLFHMLGLQNGMHAPLYLGATIVLMPRWDAALAAALIERFRVSNWNAPPAMLVDFFAQPGIDARDLSSLAFLGGGGAAMPEAVATTLQSRFGLPYVEAYGMTETAAFILSNPRHRPKRECLGVSTFGVDARVVDPATFAELPAGETGEIVLHGGQIMTGYWRNPDADAETFIEIDGKRFLRTGDLGYMDDEGYFFMRDRLKRMINANGYKVWPAEVESLLYGHPAIHEACVVAARDARRGETVKAVVVLKPGQHGAPGTDEASIIAWCREHMATYKVPRMVRFLDALPKSGTGKIQWRVLQEMDD